MVEASLPNDPDKSHARAGPNGMGQVSQERRTMAIQHTKQSSRSRFDTKPDGRPGPSNTTPD